MLAVVGVVAGTAVVVGASPASAAVTVTSSGSVVTVTASGDTNIGFDCTSGAFTAANTAASPSISCGAVTKVIVNGDTGGQTVRGFDLERPEFAGNPYLVASLGVGDDWLIETDGADTIDMGPGSDTVFINAGGSDNVSVTMGTGVNDTAYFDGTDGPDFITATSTGSNATGSVTSNDGGSNRTVQSVDSLVLRGLEGNDTIDANGVTAASSINSVTQFGGEGNDHVTAGVKPGTLYGNEGTNTLTGGEASMLMVSWSETDTIETGAGGNDGLFDTINGRSGGRTITGSTLRSYSQDQDGCDAQTRIRPSGSASVVASSLCRPGIQNLPATVGRVSVDFDDSVNSKGLADVVLPEGVDVDVRGDSFGDDLLDVTIPSGSWTSSTSNGVTTIDPANSSWGNLTFRNISAATVVTHGPWSDKNESFGHRLIRDLLYRFATTTEREAISTPLANGTKTRAQIVAATMGTDEYRGNDVDRVFVRFLKRTADPGGRTYWINALRSGRSLQKFRAQLFGSNEYFTKAGGTNKAFVRAAYFDVLGRLPDPSGEAYWTNKINNGTERGQVANAFLASTEARRAIVKDQYQRFALRLPTTSEAEQWVTKLAQPTGETDLIANLAASNAYYNAG